MRRSGLAFAALDFLGAVFVVALVQIGPPPKPADALRTEGEYAVVMSWPEKCGADEDLYLREPAGEIVFFNHTNGTIAHLSHDDIPSTGQGYKDRNVEQVVLRGILPGEFVVNVHSYAMVDCRPPVRVRVELWRLRGHDSLVTSRDLWMGDSGDEQTAFRFSLREDGSSFGVNHLSRRLVGAG